MIRQLAQEYDNGMRWDIDGSSSYMEAWEFQGLHEKLRNKAMNEVRIFSSSCVEIDFGIHHCFSSSLI